MIKFIVIVFPEEEKAYEGMSALNELPVTDGSVTVYGAALLGRDKNGNLTIKQKTGEIGMSIGAIIGGLIGLLGGPAGVAIGLGAGALAGRVRDIYEVGLAKDFLKKVSHNLEPKKSAIIAEVLEEGTDALDTRMKAIGGTVIREWRDDIEDDVIRRWIERRKAEIAELKKERSRHKSERIEAKLNEQADEAHEKLKDASGMARLWIDQYTKETNAKLAALNGQAEKTKPNVKARIDKQIGELRADLYARINKLEQARELVQEAIKEMPPIIQIVKKSGESVGILSKEDLQFLIDHLEEENIHDQDYWINAATVEMLQAEGASEQLLEVLRQALGTHQSAEIAWRKAA